jgi:hypothetical protein
MRMCLDDGVLPMVLDLALELGDQMARGDDEPPRLDPHGLVLIAAKGDEPVAAQLAALAPEQDRGTLGLGVDPFIELAEHRLIARDTTYGDGAHLAGVSVRRKTHVVDTDRSSTPGHTTNQRWFLTRPISAAAAANEPEAATAGPAHQA